MIIIKSNQVEGLTIKECMDSITNSPELKEKALNIAQLENKAYYDTLEAIATKIFYNDEDYIYIGNL